MTSTEQPPAQVTRTTLARQWLVRMIIITVVLWGFGAWALYDATVAYPRRGRLHADALKLEYLQVARNAGRLYDTSVLDPKGDLADLRGRDVTETSEFDRAKREWLDALAVPGLGMLDAEHTTIRNPEEELTRLSEFFDKRRAPSGLNDYDILMQWLILVVCWGIGAYMLVLFAMVKARKYSWDADKRTLTLPGGQRLAPADLDPADPADLSKWHKFIIFLRPRAGDTGPKGEIKLDLFRHHPLEDWVRVLVKGADPDFEFPDEKKAREEAARAAAEGEDEEGRPAVSGEN
jgi:hypothetical protein